MKKRQIAMTLGIVCFILCLCTAIQIKTIQNTNNTTLAKSLVEDGLRDDVMKEKEKYDAIYAEFEASEEQLETIREQVAQSGTNSTKKEEALKINTMYAGLTNVEGPGVVITLNDRQVTPAEAKESIVDLNLFLIHYSDILAIVNELKNAGAEAISVNNQRIVNTSSITCEGTVIKVNGEKIGAPFTIKAIGSPDLLYGLNRTGGYIWKINETGAIAEIKKSNDIKIEKYTGVMNAKYMKTVER